MKSFLTKGWILFMLAVMGLSLVGVGYTMWNKQQQIEGVINLNNVDVAFTKAFTNDDNTVDDPNKDGDDVGECLEPDGEVVPTSCDPEAVPAGDGTTPRYDQDIATCTADVDMASTGEAMWMHIFDGYPSYYCTVWFDDHVLGSLSVKLQRILLNGDVICPSTWYDVDADQDGNFDFNVHYEGPPLGTKGDSSDTIQGQIDVHVKEDAPQSKAVSFFLELIWTGSNEYDATKTGCP